jgi:putative flippase GtrA
MATAPSVFTRWLKFNAVGAIGVVVQLVLLTVLKSGFHFNYLVATAVAVEATVVHNFLWHERFTWADRIAETRVYRFAKFNLTNGLLSIAGNLLLMKWLVGSFRFPYIPANIAAIILCSLANFAVSHAYVFREISVPMAESD